MTANCNIEVKARYVDLVNARAICSKIGATFSGVLNQVDTYFRTDDRSRLKLRQINNERAELIQYDRPNDPDVRASSYAITPIADATKVAGQMLCIVRKRRELYLWHNVRIHLDEVEGLGAFIEFEGVVSPEADERISHQRVDQLVSEFGIAPSDLVGFSYSDLLMQSGLAAKHSS